MIDFPFDVLTGENAACYPVLLYMDRFLPASVQSYNCNRISRKSATNADLQQLNMNPSENEKNNDDAEVFLFLLY